MENLKDVLVKNGYMRSGPSLHELKQQHAHALAKAESLVAAAENGGRAMTAAEALDFETSMAAVNALSPKIAAIQARNTVRVTDAGVVVDGARRFTSDTKRVLSPAYQDDFYSFLRSGGTNMGAALYEGSDSAGGYIIPSVVEQQVVPLAAPDMGVVSLATVIPTVMDMKLPRKGSFGASTAKAENSLFTETDPTLEQFTLSAYMAGNFETISWELMQDVPVFQSFVADDLIMGQQIYEANKYVNGSGSGEPEGIIGNTGAGVTAEPDTNGNTVTLDGILDLIGTLKTVYHRNASFLMQRETSIVIRRAQRQSNLYLPAWERDGGVDRLYGYPVVYDSSVPSAARGNTPVVFGDFRAGYIIGLRGGAGIAVKFLDQPKALNGQLILLAYRRVDGRIRRSEALQGYTVAAS